MILLILRQHCLPSEMRALNMSRLLQYFFFACGLPFPVSCPSVKGKVFLPFATCANPSLANPTQREIIALGFCIVYRNYNCRRKTRALVHCLSSWHTPFHSVDLIKKFAALEGHNLPRLKNNLISGLIFFQTNDRGIFCSFSI